MKVQDYKDLIVALKKDYTQGEVVMVRVPKGNAHGCTQGVHPAVIVSNTVSSKHAPCVTVALITSKIKKIELPCHMLVKLEKPSMVMCEQMITISKEDIIERVAVLNGAKKAELKKCLRSFLAL